MRCSCLYKGGASSLVRHLNTHTLKLLIMSITSGAYTIRSAIQPNLFMGVQFNKGNQSKDMKVVSIREERKDRKDPHKVS